MSEQLPFDESELIEYVTQQRWFGSKSRHVAHARVMDAAQLRETEPELYTALVEVQFDPGTHQTYQILPTGHSFDALADPVHALELVRLMRAGSSVPSADGTVEFHAVNSLGEVANARPAGVEQSNTSVVFDDKLILKVYRRIEPGINPDLEIHQFLTSVGFANIAPLAGWYEYRSRATEATLGMLQAFVAGGRDGWELTLDDLEGATARLRRLGVVTGELHTALASNPSDPSFAPEEPSPESLGLLTATIDEEIEQMFLGLPDTEDVEPIRGRGEEVRDRLRMLTHAGGLGRVIRHHGDYHLGQTLWDGSDWVILDFEGEPARSVPERRRKRSPLRDVAGMLRSFAYAASASELQRGVPAPEGWEQTARAEFLAGYRETADRTLLPAADEAFDKLLSVFELEKAVYELRYELNNRPDWVRIPVAGVLRLLDGS